MVAMVGNQSVQGEISTIALAKRKQVRIRAEEDVLIHELLITAVVFIPNACQLPAPALHGEAGQRLRSGQDLRERSRDRSCGIGAGARRRRASPRSLGSSGALRG